MELLWKIKKREAARIARFVERQEVNNFVQRRIRRNVEGDRPSLTKTCVWHALATCLLTTQQRSGPQSQVYAFIGECQGSCRMKLRYAASRGRESSSTVFSGLR